MEVLKDYDENMIVESTKLVREMFDYTINKNQMDLIYTVISCVRPGDDDFKEYKITYDEIAKIYNPKNPYTSITQNEVEKSIKSIMCACFRIKTDEGNNYYNWVKNCKDRPKERCIYFKLDDDVKQFYINLQRNERTIYLLKDLLNLSTLFQANLFRLLCCNSNFNNEIKFSPDEIKERIGNNINIRTNNLTVAVERAVKQINDKTHLKVKYRIERVGNSRRIKWFVFDIKNEYIKIEEKGA